MNRTFLSPARGRKAFLFSVAVVVLLSIQSLKASVIYRQNFGYEGTIPGNTSSRVDVSSVGWQGLYQLTNHNLPSPVAQPITTAGVPYYVGIRNANGKPADEANIGTPSPSQSNVYGAVALLRLDNQHYQALMFTDHFSINLAEWRLDFVSWYSAATSTATGNALRAAFQINGQWYVSSVITSAAFLPGAGNDMTNFATRAQERVVIPNATDWYQLSATVGSNFLIGETAVELPTTGMVEASGMYATTIDVAGQIVMFDSFAISATAIPEPGSVALMSAGALAATILRRRQTRIIQRG